MGLTGWVTLALPSMMAIKGAWRFSLLSIGWFREDDAGGMPRTRLILLDRGHRHWLS